MGGWFDLERMKQWLVLTDLTWYLRSALEIAILAVVIYYVLLALERIAAGGKIKGVQVYTVARTPAEKWVTPLTTEELGRIATQVQAIGIPAEVFAD